MEEYLDIFGSAGVVVGEAGQNNKPTTLRDGQLGQDAQAAHQEAATPAPPPQVADPPHRNDSSVRNRVGGGAWSTAAHKLASGDAGVEEPLSAAVPRTLSTNRSTVGGRERVPMLPSSYAQSNKRRLTLCAKILMFVRGMHGQRCHASIL